MGIKKRIFGRMSDGSEVDLFELSNTNGMRVSITNYGGIITSILAENKYGEFSNVALGYNEFENYLKNPFYLGAIIGRNCNRLGNSTFNFNGIDYKVTANEGVNQLHGGFVGFNKVLWNSDTHYNDNECSIILTYLSKDGEEGYPGNLHVEVTYTLTNKNEIIININAITDKSTICNLTNHTYFNLKDGGNSSVLDHSLRLNSKIFTPIDENSITTGEIRNVENTPFDFRELKKISEDIEVDEEQIIKGSGYDHNFVIDGKLGELKKAAEVFEKESGRILELFTTQNCFQLYTGNFLENSVIDSGENVHPKRSGFCLEAQNFPDSPNKPNFPSSILLPGEIYNQTIIYKFCVKK